MPLEDLPSELILPRRDDIRDQYTRDVRIRVPGAVTIEGTKEFAEACVFADQAGPIYFDVKTIGDFVADVNKRGTALDNVLVRNGTSRLPAAGGTGFVQIKASVGGGTIFAGDEIKDLKTKFKYQCTATSLYTDGSLVPITGVSTGPLTNLPADSVLQWTSPRPGINPNATVIKQADGSGLSGGRDIETDAEAYARLISLRQNPPASGNDSQYQAKTQVTPAITIQQAFTYPAIIGPGTIGVTFTLRPGTPGGNRIPNAAQIADAHAWLIGQFPVDDSILMCSLLESPVTLFFRVVWAFSAVGWVDPSPWPLYIPGDTVVVDGAVTPTATTFRLTTGTTTLNPQVGQTIAFYDQPFGVFRKKRILTITTIIADKSWDITVDTTNASSDTNYTPVVGQSAGPWSESLSALVPPIATHFDSLGPGEQVSPLPDPGLRKRRSPFSPTHYPSAITNRIISPLFVLPAVADVQMLSPAVPYGTPVGNPGTLSYLLTLGSIAVFS